MKAFRPVIALLFLFNISCVRAQPTIESSVITIPVDLTSGRPNLTLMINGKGPYTFVLDTGAGVSVIDSELAAELGLKEVGETEVMSGGSGTMMAAKKVFVPMASVSNSMVSRSDTMITLGLRTMLPVDGVLSIHFFEDYLIGLDYPKNVLELTASSTLEGDTQALEYQSSGKNISVPIVINGNKHWAHLDSGNPGFINLPYDMRDDLQYKKELVEDGVARTVGGSNVKWIGQVDGDIQMGDIVYTDPEVHLTEGFTVINVGYSALKDLKTTIDLKHQLIKLEPSEGPARSSESFPLLSDHDGWYGGGVRKVFTGEDGRLYLQRGSAPELPLIEKSADFYDMVYEGGHNLMNKLPDVKFVRNEADKVIGMNFLHDDGKVEFVPRD